MKLHGLVQMLLFIYLIFNVKLSVESILGTTIVIDDKTQSNWKWNWHAHVQREWIRLIYRGQVITWKLTLDRKVFNITILILSVNYDLHKWHFLSNHILKSYYGFSNGQCNDSMKITLPPFIGNFISCKLSIILCTQV